MRIACWVTKSTDTHSEYVILIAFPLIKLFMKTPGLFYTLTYIACFVILSLSTADYSTECMHLPEQPVTVAVFGETIKET